MTDIQKDLQAYAQLSKDDLDCECHGLVYTGKNGDTLCFTANDLEAFVDLIDCSWVLERFVTGPRSYGLYQDGTRIQFIKSRRTWEFKRYKKVFAEVFIP